MSAKMLGMEATVKDAVSQSASISMRYEKVVKQLDDLSKENFA